MVQKVPFPYADLRKLENNFQYSNTGGKGKNNNNKKGQNYNLFNLS